jgi:GNAT superfamily N-acetyltransferase
MSNHPEVRLVEIDRGSPTARKEIIDFINSQMADSGLPVEDDAVRSGKLVLFWAVDPRDPSRRLGSSGYYEKTKHLAETAKTVVDQSVRGKGYGIAISQAIEDEVRGRGYKKVVTFIYVHNLPMIFIKLKQGYYIEGFHRDHDEPGLHEYSLGKVFAEADRQAALTATKKK